MLGNLEKKALLTFVVDIPFMLNLSRACMLVYFLPISVHDALLTSAMFDSKNKRESSFSGHHILITLDYSFLFRVYNLD